MWARGSALRKGHPYLATVELPLACGVQVGTPVRMRGVQIGSVLNVIPSLSSVDVQIEVGGWVVGEGTCLSKERGALDSGALVPSHSIHQAAYGRGGMAGRWTW